MSVAPFKPRPFRNARLSGDERRVTDWYDSLNDLDQCKFYALGEVKAATGIPMSRLRVTLYRLGWRVRRERGFSVYFYQGPLSLPRYAEDAGKADLAELQTILTERDGEGSSA
jgi:hypothetical protein